MIAIYRMKVDGWTAQQAYDEMKEFKFYSIWGHGDMKDFVLDYFRKLTELQAQNASSPASRPRRVVEEVRKK